MGCITTNLIWFWVWKWWNSPPKLTLLMGNLWSNGCFLNSWSTPSYHPFLDGFSLINHPAIGGTPILGPPIFFSKFDFQSVLFLRFEDLYMEFPSHDCLGWSLGIRHCSGWNPLTNYFGVHRGWVLTHIYIYTVYIYIYLSIELVHRVRLNQDNYNYLQLGYAAFDIYIYV